MGKFKNLIIELAEDVENVTGMDFETAMGFVMDIGIDGAKAFINKKKEMKSA